MNLDEPDLGAAMIRHTNLANPAAATLSRRLDSFVASAFAASGEQRGWCPKYPASKLDLRPRALPPG